MSKFSKQNKLSGSNSKVCSCGQHEGKGSGTPHEIAMIYNWFRNYERPEYEPYMAKFLNSYEKVHGNLGLTEFIYRSGRFVAEKYV